MKRILTLLGCVAIVHGVSAQVTDTGGNVGIGNAAPAHKLDVNGDINVSSGNVIRIGGNQVFSTEGLKNMFLGDGTGANLNSGSYNAVIGFKAGELVDNGQFNTLIGFKAGQNMTGANSNTIIGKEAGKDNAGNQNVLIGREAGKSASGSENTVIGDKAGLGITSGSSNTLIGKSADLSSGTLTNATAIGAGAIAGSSNSVILGNGASVGIGTSTPAYDLDVDGDVNFTGSFYNNGSPVDLTPSVFGITSGVISNENGDYTSDDFVFGSPTLDYDGDFQHRSRFFFDESKSAFRAGYTAGTNWDQDSIGTYSFAAGDDTKAAGTASIALGRDASANGIGSVALGYDPTANGTYSIAAGYRAVADGSYSVALGDFADAEGTSSIAMGYRANAVGSRSYALGYFCQSHGQGSFAIGNSTDAYGDYSFSGGNSTNADGDYAVAFGNNTDADGLGSFSIGYRSDSNGDYASSFGYETDGSSYAGMAIGRYNVGSGNDTMWVDTDPIFEVGNGTNIASRNNALTVLKNGNVGVGDATPEYELDVEGDVNFTGDLYQNGVLMGAAGPTGPTGAAGPAGAIGPTGAVGPTGPLVSGSTDQTLRYNGSSWAAASNLKNNGNTVNVGTANTNSTTTVFNVAGSISNGLGVSNLSKVDMSGTQSSGSSVALRVNNDCTGASATHMGIYNQIDGNNGQHRGVYHLLNGTTSSFKTGGYAYLNNGTGSAYGFNGNALGTGTNYGVYGQASNGSINWAGYFTGDVYSTGSYLGSDIKLKQNVEEIGSALELVTKLKPSTYQFRTEEFEALNLQEGQRFGFIAHEVKEVLPQFVKANKQEVYSEPDQNGDLKLIETIEFDVVNYTEFIPILTAAIQEQQAEIESLKEIQAENEELKNRLNRLEEMMSSFGADLQQCCFNSSSDQSESNGGDQDETNLDDQALLEQNSPNPFRDNTVIKYYLPEMTGSAQLQIANLNGAVLKTFELQGQGFGQIMISGNSFDAGTYLYTLIVDGNRIDSKRMMLF